jgi:hypothetical protein
VHAPTPLAVVCNTIDMHACVWPCVHGLWAMGIESNLLPLTLWLVDTTRYKQQRPALGRPDNSEGACSLSLLQYTTIISHLALFYTDPHRPYQV